MSTIKFNTGIVAVLDILGYKGIWQREKLTDVIENHNKIISATENKIDTAIDKTLNKINSKNKRTRRTSKEDDLIITINTISDTVIITCRGKRESLNDKINFIGNYLSEIYKIGLENKLLFRGAISIGEFYEYVEKNILIGPAIDDAAEWHQMANWSGILFTPTAKNKINLNAIQNKKEIPLMYTVPHEVPLQNGKLDTYVINWAYGYKNNHLKEKRSLEYIKSLFYSAYENVNIDKTIEVKYSNTEKFIDKMYDKA